MMRFVISASFIITAVGSFSTNFHSIAPLVIVDPRHLPQQQQQSPKTPTLQKRRRQASRLYSSTRDEEIAKLEAQLRQLRESETSESNEEESPTEATKLDPDDVRTLQEFAEARRRLEKVKGKDMLLTEQELIKGGLMDGSSSSSIFGGAVPAVAVAIAAFVGLIAFAQIPIGQDDLARYSATGSSTLKTIDLGDLNPDVAGKL